MSNDEASQQTTREVWVDVGMLIEVDVENIEEWIEEEFPENSGGSVFDVEKNGEPMAFRDLWELETIVDFEDGEVVYDGRE